METAVKIKNLEKSFGKFVIHKGVNIDIPKGKITYIMGGSGSGKSLLLKQIMGFVIPDKGTIEINGKLLNPDDSDSIKVQRRSMGILFQNGALFDSMSVYENIAFPLKEQLRLRKKEIFKEVEKLLTSVGLDMDHASKMPHELSGGQRKRIALARAIAMKPSIMMYDEPTTGLDPLTTDMVTNLIKHVGQDYNLTSIVVSHDTAAALDVAEYLAFLNEGVIQYFGSPKDVFRNQDPDVRAFFARHARTYGYGMI